jgi:hypothetical protein
VSKIITGRHVATRTGWLKAAVARAHRRAAATEAQYRAWGATTTAWKDFA